MSARLLMAQAARSQELLGGSADLVRQYLVSQIHPDGGGRNRDGASDLYYTAFVFMGLQSLGDPVTLDPLRAFLQKFGSGQGLDLPHLASLARCWALAQVSGEIGPGGPGLLAELKKYQAADGGYAPAPQATHGTLYGLYLAQGIYDDLGVAAPFGPRVGELLRSLELAEGGWANETGVPAAVATVGAAAVALLKRHCFPVPETAVAWLHKHLHPRGGFRANLAAPMPDLLTTATVLHALKALGGDLGGVRESCLDFIDSLWTNAGGFHGHWADDFLDSEYTFYGLLALGSLSEDKA